MTDRAIVSIKNLNHYFGHAGLKQQVLRSINMELYPGEIVLLTGASGSGKTTLVSLIGALRRPQQGVLKVFDNDLLKADQSLLLKTRRNIGYIFQHHNLLKVLTARQNVQMSLQLQEELSKSEIETRASSMLDMLGLKERLDYYPDELSGGQKQRVAIARALVSNPKLVIADEPTSSLDSKSGLKIMNSLQLLASKSNVAIILVTHDAGMMSGVSRRLYMEDGSLSCLSKRMSAGL